MSACRPTGDAKARVDTRACRRKAVSDTIVLLRTIEIMETEYNIPKQFAQRYDDADHACDMLAEAITSLEDAY